MPLADPEAEAELQRRIAELQAAGFSPAPAPVPSMSQGPSPVPMSQTPIGPPPPPVPPPAPTPQQSFAKRLVDAQNAGYKAAANAAVGAIAPPLTDPVIQEMAKKAIKKGVATAEAKLAAEGIGSAPQKPENRTKAPSEQEATREAERADIANAVFADNPQTAPVMPATTIIPQHTQLLMDPNRMAKWEAAAQKERAAIVKQGEAGQAIVKSQADVAHMTAEELQKQADDLRKSATAHVEEARGYQEQIDKLSKEAGDLTVDPERYFKHRGTGQLVLDMLGAALAGFVAGVRGGPNHYLEMIDARIDRDLMAQKAAIDARRGRISDMKGLLAESYRITGNLEQAEALYRGLIAQKLKEKAIEMGAGAQSLQGQANTDYAAAHYDTQHIEAGAHYEKVVPAQAVGGLGAIGKGQRELSKDLAEEKVPQAKESISIVDEIMAKNGGNIPGGTPLGRILGWLAAPDKDEHRGVTGEIANQLRGADAREADRAIFQVAEATLPPNQRSMEMIKRQYDLIKGNGSAEDVKRGLNLVRKVNQAREANIRAGARPETVQSQELLKKAYEERARPAPVDTTPVPKEAP